MLNLIFKVPAQLILSNPFNSMLEGSRSRPDPEGDGFEPVEFHSGDGCRLAGWIYRAPGKDCSNGTVFLLHGLMTNSWSNYSPAQEISEKYGVAVVGFDHRHHGRSDGHPYFPTFGGAEAFDLMAAMDLADEKGLPKPYAAVGTSLGGLAVQRATVVDERISAALLISAPANPWHAIWKFIQNAPVFGGYLTPVGNALNAAYGWDILNGGNPTFHKQPESHRPLIASIIGENDCYGFEESRKTFDFFNGGEEAWINRFPDESREIRKFFFSIPGVDHPGPGENQIWDRPEYRRFLDGFFQRAFGHQS
jgi:pimeloyl-ACP methyl ester carboxylesterase